MAIDLLGKGKKGKTPSPEGAGKEVPKAPASEKDATQESAAKAKKSLSDIAAKLGLEKYLKKKDAPAKKGAKSASTNAMPMPKLNPSALKGYLKNNISDGIKAFPRGAVEVLLRTDLENGKALIWRVTDGTLEQSTAEPSNLVASFGPNDFRIAVEAKDGFGKIAQLINVESDAKAYPISRAKDQQSAYGTPVARIEEVPYRMGPGQQALEALVAEKLTPEEIENPGVMVYGLNLKDSTSGTTLAILYAKDTLGGTSKPQVIVNSDNPEFAVNQFISARKLPKSQVKVYWFSNSEFISKVHEIQLYPNEPVFQGIAVRKLLWLGVIGCAAASVGGAGWMSLELTRNQILKVSSKDAVENTQRLTKQNSDTIASSLTSFGQIMSIDISKVIKEASAVYLRGTTLAVTADGAGTNITLRIEMKPRLPEGLSDKSVFRFRDTSELKAMLELTAPEGCTKNELQINGELNEAELTINCPSSDTRLSGYRG